MLSYQHAYHAANHADTLKHIILGELVAAMQKKETPVFLFDAFASRGMYDLHSPEAQKNREFDSGISLLWPHRHDDTVPQALQRWFSLIAEHNPDRGFDYYPGSTALLAAMLRKHDRLAACDLHPQEFDALRRSFHSSRKLALHKRDAFEALGALLPPKEKRGLVFLDPSYENKDEYTTVARTIAAVFPRFAAGVYVIWYPLLPAGRHQELFNTLKRSGIRNILRVELDCGNTFSDMQMHGSGLLIINPPWHAREHIRTSLQWVKRKLCPEQGHAHCDWLVPE